MSTLQMLVETPVGKPLQLRLPGIPEPPGPSPRKKLRLLEEEALARGVLQQDDIDLMKDTIGDCDEQVLERTEIVEQLLGAANVL